MVSVERGELVMMVLGESTGDARVECGGQLRGLRIHAVKDEV